MARSSVRILALAFCGILCCATHSCAAGRGVSVGAASGGSQRGLVKLQGEALVWLQDLIRINTTNPPGNEIVAAKYIADVLKQRRNSFGNLREHTGPRDSW